MKKKIIIVGAGIAGLMSAYILSKSSKFDITLIEQEVEVGGLLKKYDYGEFGIFDYGMHNVLETGINELDNLIYDLLPTDEWQILDGNKRDLVGLYVNKKIQKNSPYIDLREFDNYDKYLLDFFNNSDCHIQDLANYSNAQEFLHAKYGTKIVDEVLKNIVEKFYKEDISKLDPLATLVTPLGRVILLNESIMNEINTSEILRSKLAYSEQRNLDLSLSSGRKAYYPKNYGMHKIIDALIEKLNANGVRILLNTELISIQADLNNIKAIQLTNDEQINEIDEFIWSGNLFVLSELLKIDHEPFVFDTPAKTTVTNIIVDKKLSLIDDVYYIYCYDSQMSTFRVTPYYNYCDGSKRAGGYPVSIEMLIYENDIDKDKITQQALDEIKKMGLIDDTTNIIFQTSEILKNGFPRPTKNNIQITDTFRKNLEDKQIKNLHKIGILSEKNLFFQTDILIDLYHKLGTLK